MGTQCEGIADMHFWRREYFQTLKDVAAEASRSPDWADYATFCVEYESGFRKKAFATLDGFISKYERAPFLERRRFVRWLLTQAEGREGRHMLLPHPLNIRLVEPTLLEWTFVEPDCSEPHKWLGGLEHLREALALNPNDDLARQKLIVSILGQVSFAAYDLPLNYIGDFREDLAAFSEAEQLIPKLQNEQLRNSFASELKIDRERILEFIRHREMQ